MIVKRWGKYRALEDFADVKKDDVIDVTGVMEGPHEIMWACNGRISDWHEWDIPVVGPQTTISTQNDNVRRRKSLSGSNAVSTACDVIDRMTVESEVGGREYPSGYSQGSSEVVQLSVVCNLPSHPKCLTCSHSSGWDSSGLGFCTQPLGISSLFDENARFPITDEQYCSNHSQVKNDLRLPSTDSREKE